MRLFFFSCVLCSSVALYAAENQKDNSKMREPAQSKSLATLGSSDYVNVAKIVDPENGTICYVAYQNDYRGGTSIQCFPKK